MRGGWVEWYLGNENFLALVLRENPDGTLNLAVFLDTEKCPVTMRDGYIRIERNVRKRDLREQSNTWAEIGWAPEVSAESLI